MTRLDLDLPDVTWIDDRHVDVGSEASYKAILDRLPAQGYRLGYELQGDPDAESGKSAYAYIMPDTARVKCRSCGGLSSIDGSACHGKKCGHCKQVIYRTVYPGVVISCSFDKSAFAGPRAWLTVVRWDEAEGYLYCKQRLPDGLSPQQLRETSMLLRHYSDQLVSVAGEHDELLYKIRYSATRDDGVIYSVYAYGEAEVGYDEVLYWNGTEYPAHSSDPALPKMFKVYKMW